MILIRTSTFPFLLLLLASCGPKYFFSEPRPEPDALISDSVVVIKVRTAQPLDLRSFNAESFFLSGSKTGPLTARIRFDANNNELSMTIVDSLHRNEYVDIILTDKIRTTTGENIPQNVGWRFWVWQARWQFPGDSTKFVDVDELPEPIGGIAAIQGAVVYPEVARRKGIQGTVYVETYLDEFGVVTKTQVIKGIGGGCDEAAEAAIRRIRFIPGRQKGKAVKVRMSIPIRFRLGR